MKQAITVQHLINDKTKEHWIIAECSKKAMQVEWDKELNKEENHKEAALMLFASEFDTAKYKLEGGWAVENNFSYWVQVEK